jgi:hypothetical protein
LRIKENIVPLYTQYQSDTTPPIYFKDVVDQYKQLEGKAFNGFFATSTNKLC